MAQRDYVGGNMPKRGDMGSVLWYNMVLMMGFIMTNNHFDRIVCHV